PLVGERSSPLLERSILGEDRLRIGQLANSRGHVVLENRQEQLGLPVEVGIDRAVGIAGLLRDLLNARRAKAAASEHPRCSVDQSGAGLRLLFGPGEARCHVWMVDRTQIISTI